MRNKYINMLDLAREVFGRKPKNQQYQRFNNMTRADTLKLAELGISWNLECKDAGNNDRWTDDGSDLVYIGDQEIVKKYRFPRENKEAVIALLKDESHLLGVTNTNG